MVRHNDAGNASHVSFERRQRRREKRSHQRQLQLQLQHQRLLRHNLSVRNFRPVSGFGEEAKIYRCGSTDILGAKLRYCGSSKNAAARNNNLPWSEADDLVSKDAGLIIDLRSPPERREDDALLWMRGFISGENENQRQRPIRLVAIPLGEGGDASKNAEDDNIFGESNVDNMRYVIRLDVLNRAELLNYAREKWLSLPASAPTQASSLSSSLSSTATISAFDRTDEANNQIMTELNRRGLAGLNEAILETRSGQMGMCLALQLVTLYREAMARAAAARKEAPLEHQSDNSGSGSNDKCKQYASHVARSASIVFHCVQGKDRTGMLAMLMQLLMGCSDNVIVEDYYRSNADFVAGVTAASSLDESSSAAASAMVAKQAQRTESNTNGEKTSNRPAIVRMEASVFRGTNRPAMVSTLEGLRLKHGNSLDGYFDRIGFDVSWRNRFVAAFGGAKPRATWANGASGKGRGERNRRTTIPPPSSRL